MALVYKHYKKDTKELFYVGISINNRRPYEKKSINILWHNIVNKHGYYVEIYIDNISYAQAIVEEKKLILQYGRIDLGTGILCNMTSGGDGNNDMSNETKEKISLSLKGKKQSKETIEKRIKTLKPIWSSNEFKELKRAQSIELNKLGLIGTKGIESKKKGIELTECVKLKISNSLLNYYKENPKSQSNRISYNDEDVNKIISDYSSGISSKKIAISFGVTPKVIIRVLKENNIDMRERKLIPRDEFYIQYITLNKTQAEMSNYFKCSISNIQKLVSLYKITKK